MSISRDFRSRRAFTLLEVMLAIGILALLTGVMLSLVEKTMEATVTLEQEQQRMAQRQGVLDLLRATFRTLPNDAQFISRRISGNNGTQQQLVFANAPTVFAWGNPDELLHSSAILSGQPQTGGGFTLSLKRVPPPDVDLAPDSTPDFIALLPQEGSSDDSASWLTLLENLKSLQWRFFDPRTVAWVDDWTDQSTRPTLVELQWQYVDEEVIQRYVFWVPPITPNARPRYASSGTAQRNATTGGGGNGGGSTGTPNGGGTAPVNRPNPGGQR